MLVYLHSYTLNKSHFLQVQIPDLLILDEPLAGLGMKINFAIHNHNNIVYKLKKLNKSQTRGFNEIGNSIKEIVDHLIHVFLLTWWNFYLWNCRNLRSWP